MKKHLLKSSVLAVLSAVTLALAACGGDNDAPQATPTPTPTPDAPAVTEVVDEDEPTAEEGVRDLGGIEIVMGNWWGDWDTDTFIPDTAFSEAELDMRIAAESRYNFRLREQFIATWGELAEMFVSSIMAGDPAAHVMILEPQHWVPLYNQGLLAELVGPTIDFTDRSLAPWNQTMIDAHTFGGSPYAFAQGDLTGGGLFWNFRLFEEAGLDPELPFDLMMSGDWTWDALSDIMLQTTRDIDNTGVIDTWAFAGGAGWTFQLVLASNATYYVGRDAAGNFYNATNSAQFLEAYNFARSWAIDGFMMQQPEGSEWNWFFDAFRTGQVAMMTGFNWMSWGELADMTDTIGFVPFPMGPSATNFGFMAATNVMAIPYQLQDLADDIVFAVSHWFATPEGWDDPYDWMNTYLPLFHHPRSVEQSLRYFNRNQDLIQANFAQFIPALGVGPMFYWHLWDLGTDVAYIIESAQPQINALIDEANN